MSTASAYRGSSRTRCAGFSDRQLAARAAVRSCHVIDTDASDHRPVVAELAVT
jgi:endonuclease/exonuclease/phosphatase family metal-dependent hydrolase